MKTNTNKYIFTIYLYYLLLIKMMWIRFVLVSAFAVSGVLLEESTCTTPKKQQGLCVLLQACPSIYLMSSDFDSPMTIEKLDFLIESQCGFMDNYPKVCCPLEELQNNNSEILL